MQGWNTPMRDVIHFLKANDAYFVLGLSVLSLFLFTYAMILTRKLTNMSRKRGVKLEDSHVDDMIDHLGEQADAVNEIARRLEAISARQNELSNALSNCLQNTGIVRFDAFEDVGGEQSFALVLLDGNKNGVALSSLYARHDSRVYAKAISSGKGERPLSEEEQHALGVALGLITAEKQK